MGPPDDQHPQWFLRVVSLEEKHDALVEKVSDIAQEIHAKPDGIRWRLHDLSNKMQRILHLADGLEEKLPAIDERQQTMRDDLADIKAWGKLLAWGIPLLTTIAITAAVTIIGHYWK